MVTCLQNNNVKILLYLNLIPASCLLISGDSYFMHFLFLITNMLQTLITTQDEVGTRVSRPTSECPSLEVLG